MNGDRLSKRCIKKMAEVKESNIFQRDILPNPRVVTGE
jgi:hypothetical protein